MTKVGFTHGEAWDLIYLLKAIVAQSEYNENIELYGLRDDVIIAHNAEDWKRLHTIIAKLEEAYGIRIDLGDTFG